MEFINIKDIKPTVNIRKGERTTTFACSYCSREFASISSKQRHERSQHTTVNETKKDMHQMASFVVICKSKKQVEDFINEMQKSTHTKYVTDKIAKSFTNDDWQPSGKDHIYFERNIQGQTSFIPFTGTPFASIGTKYLICHLGYDRSKANKKRYAERMKIGDNIYKKKRKVGTKKVNCPARMNISRVAFFLDEKFQIEKNTVRNRKRSSSLIKDALSKNEQVTLESRYYVCVPRLEDHVGHPILGKVSSIAEETENKSTSNTDWHDEKVDYRNKNPSEELVEVIIDDDLMVQDHHINENIEFVIEEDLKLQAYPVNNTKTNIDTLRKICIEESETISRLLCHLQDEESLIDTKDTLEILKNNILANIADVIKR